MLRVEHLTKVYPNGTVGLKAVSFSVQDGEFLAVIGLSGSGKSTLLRCINRLIEPTSGKVYWDDVDITALRARKPVTAVGIAFAAQEVAEVPHTPRDAPLDLVLTECEVIDCRTS